MGEIRDERSGLIGGSDQASGRRECDSDGCCVGGIGGRIGFGRRCSVTRAAGQARAGG